MSGHLFAFQGDLTQRARDAWLPPADRRAFVEKYWSANNPWLLPPERRRRRGERILGDRLVVPLAALHPTRGGSGWARSAAGG